MHRPLELRTSLIHPWLVLAFKHELEGVVIWDPRDLPFEAGNPVTEGQAVLEPDVGAEFPGSTHGTAEMPGGRVGVVYSTLLEPDEADVNS